MKINNSYRVGKTKPASAGFLLPAIVRAYLRTSVSVFILYVVSEVLTLARELVGKAPMQPRSRGHATTRVPNVPAF